MKKLVMRVRHWVWDRYWNARVRWGDEIREYRWKWKKRRSASLMSQEITLRINNSRHI